MKVMNIVLSTVIALSAVKGFASEDAAPAPLTAIQVLSQQYQELEDLRNQVEKVRSKRSAGTVGIVISTLAVGAGALISTMEGFSGAIVNIGAKALGAEESPMKKIGVGELIAFGGAAGIVGSTAVIVVQTKNLHQLIAQIDKLEAQIKATSAQLK